MLPTVKTPDAYLASLPANVDTKNLEPDSAVFVRPSATFR
jgi:adenylate kinase